MEFSMSEMLIAEGKTKQVFSLPNYPDLVKILFHDNIISDDGKKCDVLPKKGELSNTIDCHVFGLLRQCGLPVATIVRAENAVHHALPIMAGYNPKLYMELQFEKEQGLCNFMIL